MYTFSSKLKTFSIVLMVLGLLGIGYGFLTAPKTIQDVEKILASQQEHEGHGEATAGEKQAAPASEVTPMRLDEPNAVANATATAPVDQKTDTAGIAVPAPGSMPEAAVPGTQHHEKVADEHAEHQQHLKHVLSQLQNKPWAAVYVACIFFMLISLGVLAFYAIQIAAQAGWSPVLFRVMQGISGYLPIASVIFFVLLICSGMHLNNLFPWLAQGITDPKSPNFDHVIANKSGYLNFGFWIGRAIVFLVGWNLYRYLTRKNCIAQDESDNNSFYKRNFKLSAGFLVFFIVSESLMSWDWIMSTDPHWFSTLFGWYVFSSFIVSGITVINLYALYLTSRGYLEFVNTSHIHDLGKYMFGFSIFWTYLWFAQFMLIWYANIPEEITYFVTRINDYNLLFFGALVLNFVLPVLIFVHTDFKRIAWIVVGVSVAVLIGHYIDFYNMIMPAAAGDQWFIGVPEIGAVLFFMGLFIIVTFTALTKAPLLPKRSPYIEESKHFQY
jgi:hypothetical protein